MVEVTGAPSSAPSRRARREVRNGACAHMFAGATLPDARGRGAQSALLAARLRAAPAEGCRWIVAETGVEGPGEHNPSLRNLVRAGFEPMYDRPDWLWHARPK
ncbi:hypothetical protein ABT147_28960 [Streptomyces sp. NPDC001868]|uniref:hypothetical protein n=1 Tax=Streptomyces sp. NPDC001868 TaxID=3154401 RepID=UPI00332AFF97